MSSVDECSKCGKSLKTKEEEVFGQKGIPSLKYCPKCEFVNEVGFS